MPRGTGVSAWAAGAVRTAAPLPAAFPVAAPRPGPEPVPRPEARGPIPGAAAVPLGPAAVRRVSPGSSGSAMKRRPPSRSTCSAMEGRPASRAAFTAAATSCRLLHLAPAGAQDHVALLQAPLGGDAVGAHLRHHRAALLAGRRRGQRQAERAGARGLAAARHSARPCGSPATVPTVIRCSARLAVAHHRDRRRLARLHAGHRHGEVARRRHGLAVEADHHVAGLQAALGRRAVRLDLRDQRALALGRPAPRCASSVVHRAAWRRRASRAPPGRVSRSCATTCWAIFGGTAKPMPAEAPEGEKIAVFTPITSPWRVEQRAARVAGVHRGVGLQEVVIGAGADLAAARRDDAGGRRAARGRRGCPWRAPTRPRAPRRCRRSGTAGSGVGRPRP